VTIIPGRMHWRVRPVPLFLVVTCSPGQG